VETETFAALTASRRSPERRRSQAEVRRRGLTGPPTTVLGGREERIGTSGNLWWNWGYLAGLRQAQKNRWRQPTGRWRSERDNLAPQVGLEPTTLRLTAEPVIAASRCKHKTYTGERPGFAEIRGTLGGRALDVSPSIHRETEQPSFSLFNRVLVPPVLAKYIAKKQQASLTIRLLLDGEISVPNL
jgi:hypothetical protein